MSERSPRLRGLRPRTQLRSPHTPKVRSEASEGEEIEESAGRTRNNRNQKPERPASPRDDSDEDELHIEIKDEQDEEASEDKSDGERNYECKTCKTPIGFPTLVEYLRHLRDEHKEKGRSYECPHCDFSCQHPKKLKAHCNSEHKDLEDVATTEESVEHRCTMCPYIANDSNELENHQRVHHLKRRFFRCTKCSYMTHVRARYTKHVKYHSMPMIKCVDCDFRTPYKWNLDRHTRNHGGGGTFQCRACNFTADIRQSLTVHETNHHEPPVGQSHKKPNTPFERKPRNGPKRYNQVGASDYRDLPHSTSPSPVKTGSPVKSPSSDVGSSSLEERRNAIAGAECIALKCEEKGCQFITAWDSEMQRHLAESHAPSISPVRPRKPLPMLIPLSPDNNASTNNGPTNGSKKPTTTSATATLLKVPRVRVRPELAKIARDTEMAKMYGQREPGTTKKDAANSDSFEKRNASFFDKLKERLMTTSANVAGGNQSAVSSANDLKCWCTFEAISPEDLASHSQSHHAALSVSVGINRCPKCRRRCKSSTDLQMHMRLCQTTINDLMTIDNYPENPTISANYTAASYCPDFEFPFQVDWDGSFGGLNSSGSSVEGVSGHPHGRRVFKCPHCPFWASTASRFHVHIVGHLNRKPFECSLCAYRSNWRWDITKHIKLKAARDSAHMTARVLMTDETGRRNYSKYNKYLAQIEQQGADESGLEEGPVGESRIDEPPKKMLIMSESKDYSEGPPELTPAPGIDHADTNSMSILTALNLRPPPPLKSAARSHGQSLLKNNPTAPSASSSPVATPAATVATIANSPATDETKRTLWKCKRCTFRDSNKETVLLHVKSHYDGFENSCGDGEKTNFTCPDCPYTSEDPTAMAIHRIHHRPNLEAIFKCYLCPYYVSTKAELLEHARLHGEELAVVHQRSVDSSSPATKHKSPQRSFTDNETSNKSAIAVEEISEPTARSSRIPENPPPDDSTTPMLLDTRALPDTPLVWVSRPDGTLTKMLKCRHCPHVSSRRAEVRDHETMHVNAPTSGNSVACPDCSFTCSRRDVMEAHADMHMGSLGTVHCLVDDARTDAQQLDDLTTLLGLTRTPVLGSEPDLRDPRLVHCCSKCPARFLCDKELRIHLRYHSTELAYSCQWCSYAARQQAHLSAHQKAHSTEYQDRTRYLLSIYGHSQRYAPPSTACVESNERQTPGNSRAERSNDRSSNIAWIVVEIGTNSSQNYSPTINVDDSKTANQVFTCAKCPARYFRLDALEYHMTLHGSNNRFKCSECDYSSKTAQNLLKHQVVHRRHVESNEPTATRSPANRQIEQRCVAPTRGNPNFVYPGCLRNGRMKEKRYKCNKCPSAFEKREQYRVHLTLHGAKQRYRCDKCDYSVKYYANYTQHLKKHQANAQAQASKRRNEPEETIAIEDIVEDLEIADVRVTKNRRKSTITSTNATNHEISVVGGSNSTGLQQTSNQDKQSVMLMQRKGLATLANEANEKIIRCQDCPFSSTDKETMDGHRRRHGIERLTPSCPHCNYVPRKDENIGEHIRLHFTRLYKPESYLIVEMLTLNVRKIDDETKDGTKDGEKNDEAEILFRECADGTYLPANETTNQAIASTSSANGYQEKVVVDPNTVDRRDIKNAPKN